MTNQLNIEPVVDVKAMVGNLVKVKANGKKYSERKLQLSPEGKLFVNYHGFNLEVKPLEGDITKYILVEGIEPITVKASENKELTEAKANAKKEKEALKAKKAEEAKAKKEAEAKAKAEEKAKKEAEAKKAEEAAKKAEAKAKKEAEAKAKKEAAKKEEEAKKAEATA